MSQAPSRSHISGRFEGPLGLLHACSLGIAAALPDGQPWAALAGWAGMLLGPPAIGLFSHATSLPLALGLLPVLCATVALGARALR